RSRRAKSREVALDDVLPALDGDGLHFEPMDDWTPRVDDNAVNGELRDVLEKAIAELPSDYRTALVMHDVEGMPNPDIAETLGISLPAVKSRVHRSRLFVRKKLADYMANA
ncbi:MAG TPA: sigma-70 family RNA polymerase sigma factor, partial [Terriglobales bacterium]|nr:sigma-70 family RNA polymerase sigma factor [Terriglobales bacterium]